jgi:hypothetical protein
VAEKSHHVQEQTMNINGPMIELEPGNGTRYALMIAEDGDQVLVAWLRTSDVGGVAMRIPKRQDFEISYVAEKMGIGAGDAAAICAYLRQHYELDIRIPRTFDQETGVWIHEGRVH